MILDPNFYPKNGKPTGNINGSASEPLWPNEESRIHGYEENVGDTFRWKKSFQKQDCWHYLTLYNYTSQAERNEGRFVTRKCYKYLHEECNGYGYGYEGKAPFRQRMNCRCYCHGE